MLVPHEIAIVARFGARQLARFDAPSVAHFIARSLAHFVARLDDQRARGARAAA